MCHHLGTETAGCRSQRSRVHIPLSQCLQDHIQVLIQLAFRSEPAALHSQPLKLKAGVSTWMSTRLWDRAGSCPWSPTLFSFIPMHTAAEWESAIAIWVRCCIYLLAPPFVPFFTYWAGYSLGHGCSSVLDIYSVHQGVANPLLRLSGNIQI